MTVRTLLINATHCSNNAGNKNEYIYKFLGGGLDLPVDKKHSLALCSISIPYSFFNISDVYNNRSFRIIVPTGALGATTGFDINLPASFMDINDLNKYFQFWSIQNNFYTLDAYGNYEYYIELQYNINKYVVEVIFYPLTLKSGSTNPNSMYMSGTTMQLQISQSNAGFGRLLGLTPSTYPSSPQSVTTTQQSNMTVEGSPIQALNICANIINNSISSTPDTFYSFSPSSTSFGSSINYNPPELIWCDLYAGRHMQLILSIKDQLNRDVQMRDSTVCILLAIKSE